MRCKIKTSFAKCVLVSSLLAGSGCGALTSHYGPPGDYDGPAQISSQVAANFQYRKEGTSLERLVDTALLESRDTLYFTCEKRSFKSFDVPLGKETEITFEYYKTKLQTNAPLVLVSPILGGSYPFERPICELLAENGISSVLIYRPRRMLRFGTYPSLETMLRSIVSDRRKVLDTVLSGGSIDEQKIGSFGISMGAITNVPLIAVEPRLRYHVLGLPGGDIPSILLESTEEQIEEFVEEHTQALHLTRDGFKAHLKKDYDCDPLDLASSIDPRNVRMFLGYFDTIVPFKYGRRLHRAMGEPELNILPTGHYTAALYYFWIRDMTLGFFQERFKLDADALDSKKKELMDAYRRTHPWQRKVS